MTSPEAVQPIRSKEELYEEKLSNEWLDELVTEGMASSREVAREEMLRLRDSLVSPESEINQLMEQKIEEILAIGSPLTDNKERSYQIVKNLAEIYQRRPELCRAERGSPLSDPEWKEKLVYRAEQQITYSFPIKVLRALGQRYETDEMRKEWTMAMLGPCLEDLQKSVDAVFLKGDPNIEGQEAIFDEEQLNRLSRDNQDALPVVRELLNALTPENAEETYQKIKSLIQHLTDTIYERYPYIQTVEQFVYPYKKEDEPGRTAVHVGVTGTMVLALLEAKRLKYMLLGDLYEIKEKLGHYVTLMDTTPKSKWREVPKDRPLEEKDIQRLFLGYKALIGKTSDEAAEILLKELKEIARAPEAEK
ncbi:MAG: hypothetical protein KBD16_01095 [Candidatus Pacebacteria bacterium]|nr:hypothetical protein [Candidatus Paceibacterota bacterium]